jgi:hypothetical protein
MRFPAQQPTRSALESRLQADRSFVRKGGPVRPFLFPKKNLHTRGIEVSQSRSKNHLGFLGTEGKPLEGNDRCLATEGKPLEGNDRCLAG